MAEFVPITINTQEEMDALFKDRVARAEKKFVGYVAPDAVEALKADYEKQLSENAKALEAASTASAEKLTELEKAIADKDAALKANELSKAKTTIALQMGIPFELAERLTGTTEEEIRKDAEMLSSVVAAKNVPPLRNQEANAEENGVMAAFRKLNPNLKI